MCQKEVWLCMNEIHPWSCKNSEFSKSTINTLYRSPWSIHYKAIQREETYNRQHGCKEDVSSTSKLVV